MKYAFTTSCIAISIGMMTWISRLPQPAAPLVRNALPLPEREGARADGPATPAVSIDDLP